ncbi:hypothetical protein QQF64_022361 [Cirrhinus molitorella]|uniref:MADF domain-containing protein n=1 Tax=Cirrhinus molitorella TaxID=172907 RepID=A0ABR3L896_9TELE
MEAKNSKKYTGLWDSHKEQILLELWQQRACLYNVSSSCYHGHVKKDAAWKEIAEELQLPVGEVITQVASLRTQYGKLLHPKPRGSGAKELTPRQNWIMKHLHFLKCHVLPRQAFSTLEQVASEMCLIKDPIEKMQARWSIMRILYDAQDRSMSNTKQMSTYTYAASQPVYHNLSSLGSQQLGSCHFHQS